MNKIIIPTGDRSIFPMLVVEAAYDADGNLIPLGSMSQEFGYDGADNLVSIKASNDAGTWIQTHTYETGRLLSISRWVKQP